MSNDFQPTISPDNIKGNASLECREFLSNPAAFLSRPSESLADPVFCDSIHRRLVVTEALIQNKQQDEKKKEAVVVIELDVTDGGRDWRSFHCPYWSVCRYDESWEWHPWRLYCISHWYVCNLFFSTRCYTNMSYSLTTFALIAYSIDVDKEFFVGVSQSINVTYHSPAAAYVCSPRQILFLALCCGL